MNTISDISVFRKWLMKQPDDREFIYKEGRFDSKVGCLICNFLREHDFIFHHVGPYEIKIDDEYIINIPDWLINLRIQKMYPGSSTAKEYKEKFIRLHGNITI